MGDLLSGAAGGRLGNLEDLDVRHSDLYGMGKRVRSLKDSDGLLPVWCVTQWEEIEKAVVCRQQVWAVGTQKWGPQQSVMLVLPT